MITDDELNKLTLRCNQEFDGEAHLTCDELTRLIIEIRSSRAARVRVVAIVAALSDAVDAAVRDHQRRGKGGQQVSFHGDFANATPSVLSRIGWYARELRIATSGAEVTLASPEPPA